MSSAAGFQFRGACEPCHRRKIRCIIPPGESSCTLCTHSGIACLFAPRRKPGRPKRLGSSNSAAAAEKQPSPTSRQWSSSESPPPVEMKHEAPPMPEMDNNPMPDMNNADSMNVFWSSLSSGDESYVNTANWGDAATQLSYAHHDHSGMNCVPESMQYSLSQPVPGMQRSDSYSTFGSMPDMSHGSFQSRSIPSSTAATTDNDVSFDTTMQLCKDLHEYRSHVSRRPSFSPSVHHNLFHDMLRMCTAATNMPPQNTSGPACPATALVLAAMLQFLDVCGLIISRLSDSSSMSTPASTHLENMFLLRKMDLVLLPTKLFLSDKGHHAGVARAQALHHEIEAVISNEYPQLAWGDGQGMLTAGQGEMFQQQM